MGRKLEKDSFRVNFKHFHIRYKKHKREAGERDSIVDAKTFRTVVSNFFIQLINKIVTEGFVFHMPYGSGSIRLNQRNYSPNGIVDMLRLKAWDKSFYFHWEKGFFKCSELRVYRPSAYMMTQKKKRILMQNDDPYVRDMIAHMSKTYERRFEALRKNYKRKLNNEVLESTPVDSD